MAKTPQNDPKPLQIKRGNVSVSVYTGRNRVDGKNYPQYTVVYYLGAKRKRRRFADLDRAKREAELIATKMANAEHEALKLSPIDRARYTQALDTLRPIGKSLDLAVGEYVESLNRLPERISLRDAVDFFLKRNPDCYPKRRVAEVAEEMLAVKERAGRSEIHLKDMQGRLNRFSRAFSMNIGDITGLMIQGYIDELPVKGRTKKNHLRLITTLFKFAVKRKYLPKDAMEELEAVEMPEIEHNEIQIFTPEELAEMFTCSRSEIVPWLAIASFAGLRSAEIQRLEWSDVDLSEKVITVPASKSKTASRRLAPIPDNLARWLSPYSSLDGRVTAFENMAKQIDWLVRDVNAARKKRGERPDFVWKRNGLRHSFVSYRIAQIKDAAQVALECGNSPTMVFKHYRQLVTESRSRQWFSVEPETDENVIAYDPTSSAA